MGQSHAADTLFEPPADRLGARLHEEVFGALPVSVGRALDVPQVEAGGVRHPLGGGAVGRHRDQPAPAGELGHRRRDLVRRPRDDDGGLLVHQL